MSAILESEQRRLAEQSRIDLQKTAKERNVLGQFATPPALALEIAKYAWSHLRRRRETYHFFDPAVGTGSFYSAFLQAFPADRIESAVGIEIDGAFTEAATSIWRPHGLEVVHGDFTKLRPKRPANLLLANPPYVRHHHIGTAEKRRLGMLVKQSSGLQISGLAGLYCYFMLLAHEWLADNGFAAWLVPSEFMDVNYGLAIKRYLTDNVSLLRIHRYCPADVQFDDALVSSAVVVYEKRKPKPEHVAEFSFGGTLADPRESRAVSLNDLRETRKWSALVGHAKKNIARAACASRVCLGDLFTVNRGIATGRNSFFVVPKKKLRELGIPLECVKPVLPSPRFLKQEIIESGEDGWPAIDNPLALIDCRYGEEFIRQHWPKFWEYLQEGRRKGIDQGYITSRRSPWYSQEQREPATFLCTYMGRSRERPFRFLWNRSRATAANVYLLLYPKKGFAEAVQTHADAVFRSLQAIAPADYFENGRVYGGGLHKMEPKELMRLPADELAEMLGVQCTEQLALFA